MAEQQPSVKAWSHFTPPFPSTLSQIDVSPPSPSQLGDTEILVELYSASLNPVDVQLVNLPIFKLPALQGHRGLGKDFAGKVLAKGSKVVGEYSVEDEVMGVTINPLGGAITGTLSQVSLIDTTRSCIVPKPTHLTFPEAASLPLVFLTAVPCLSPPYLQLPAPSSSSRPTIVVLGGSSAAGIYTIQYATLKLGLRVIATCSTRNKAFVESLGVSHVVDYTTESIADRLRELRPSEGYISIVDCVGGTELLNSGIWTELLHPRSGQLREGGSYVTIVGDKTSRSRLGGSMTNYWTTSQMWRSWKGWFGWCPRYYCISLNMEKKEWLEQVGALVKEKGMKVVIDSEFGFDEVEKAFERLNSGKATGKVVVNVKNTSR
ncbi:NAD(P)-dependent alcohol dehydrogenase [Sporobolomyces salmoneus]|uniref:NAD(P)-dependent alcohol dehydrogenase n=1 Tax=Sporobolomyces salmoneus TaxID=183962 RepID=UPI003180C498